MENPLYERLIRDHSMPQLPGFIGVALLVAVATVLISQEVGARTVADAQAMMLLPALVLLVVPVITAGGTAFITARYAASDEYQMLRVSPITPDVLVWGYFRAVLYRFQMLYAVGLGLIPLPVSIVATSPLLRLWFGQTALGLAALMIGLAASNLTAAAWGMMLGLRFHSVVPAVALAVMPFAALIGLGLFAYPIVTSTSTCCGFPPITPNLPSVFADVMLVIVLILPALALPILRISERWV